MSQENVELIGEGVRKLARVKNATSDEIRLPTPQPPLI